VFRPRVLVGAVVIEHAFGVLQRQRREPRDLGGPGLRIGQCPDPVGHPGLKRNLGCEPLSAEQHAPRPPGADQRGQSPDTPVVQRQTVFRDGELEVRFRCDDAKIADQRQDDACADRRAVDRADNGHRRGVDGKVQRLGLVGQFLGHASGIGQVRTRAEHVTLPGQHDDADIVGGGLLDRLTQPVDQSAVQRVAALGALHLQGHHVAVAGHTNHGLKPIRVIL
jgi:hypothetical protein